MGLLIFESPEAADGISEGDVVEVEPETGVVKNVTTGHTYTVAAIPKFMKALLDDGGLICHIRKTSGQPNA